MDEFGHVSNNWTSVHGEPLKLNGVPLKFGTTSHGAHFKYHENLVSCLGLEVGRLPWSIKGGAQ